ncbi:MAG: hypothetical protein LBF15_01825 [Candidatus Peribacteria bacterium]|nr:hypothetical protein [Candidatus Peribacteria bacterium]
MDRYNFREFEKAKVILDTIEKGTVKFSNINEFNEVYDTNIKPIKNCYMINSSN